MAKSTFHTDANYERLVAMIRRMTTVEEFVAAFPECIDPEVADEYPLERVWDEVREMQAIPRDTVNGILGHICQVCGGMKVGIRTILEANFVRIRPACLKKVLALFQPGTHWNGITKRGFNVVLGIVQREFRIPSSSEIQHYELKRRPKQRTG